MGINNRTWREEKALRTAEYTRERVRVYPVFFPSTSSIFSLKIEMPLTVFIDFAGEETVVARLPLIDASAPPVTAAEE